MLLSTNLRKQPFHVNQLPHLKHLTKPIKSLLVPQIIQALLKMSNKWIAYGNVPYQYVILYLHYLVLTNSLDWFY